MWQLSVLNWVVEGASRMVSQGSGRYKAEPENARMNKTEPENALMNFKIMT